MEKEKEISAVLDLVADYGQARFNIGKGEHGNDGTEFLTAIGTKLSELLSDKILREEKARDMPPVHALKDAEGNKLGLVVGFSADKILSEYGRDTLRKLSFIFVVEAAMTNQDKDAVDAVRKNAAKIMEQAATTIALSTAASMAKDDVAAAYLSDFLSTGDSAKLEPLWEHLRKAVP